LRGGDDTVADRQMPGGSNLAAENHLISYVRAAGQACLSAKQSVLSDGRAMTDLNEVIDLRAAPDCRSSDARAVDDRTGAYFDIIRYYDGSGLRDLLPGGIRMPGIAKTIASYHNMVLQDNAQAETTLLTYDAVRVNEGLVADLGVRI
jgi:hypothetical protein